MLHQETTPSAVCESVLKGIVEMVCVLKLVSTVAGRAAWPMKLFHFTMHSSEEPLRKIKPYQTKHRIGTFDYVNLNWVIPPKRKCCERKINL